MNKPPPKPSDAAEAAMISTIALKDPSVREIYEIKAEMNPPNDLKSAVKLLNTILAGRERNQDLDRLAAGELPGPRPVLQVQQAPPQPQAEPEADPLRQILAAITADPKKLATPTGPSRRARPTPAKSSQTTAPSSPPPSSRSSSPRASATTAPSPTAASCHRGLSWGSLRQKCTALSSCEAEIIALSEATKDMVYMRKLVKGLGEADSSGPSSLATDSQSARDVSYNPENHSRMKHVARRHFFVRDMVESLEIEVPFVRTDDMVADFLTKQMKSAPQFFKLRAIVMNEPIPGERDRTGAPRVHFSSSDDAQPTAGSAPVRRGASVIASPGRSTPSVAPGPSKSPARARVCGE
jgi:hypothetical protein